MATQLWHSVWCGRAWHPASLHLPTLPYTHLHTLSKTPSLLHIHTFTGTFCTHTLSLIASPHTKHLSTFPTPPPPDSSTHARRPHNSTRSPHTLSQITSFHTCAHSPYTHTQIFSHRCFLYIHTLFDTPHAATHTTPLHTHTYTCCW